MVIGTLKYYYNGSSIGQSWDREVTMLTTAWAGPAGIGLGPEEGFVSAIVSGENSQAHDIRLPVKCPKGDKKMQFYHARAALALLHAEAVKYHRQHLISAGVLEHDMLLMTAEFEWSEEAKRYFAPYL